MGAIPKLLLQGGPKLYHFQKFITSVSPAFDVER